MELLVKYCSEKLIELSFENFSLTIEDEITLKPLLKTLQRFHLIRCQCNAQLFEMLPAWCPELRELTIKKIELQYGLRTRFKKLTKIWFAAVQLHHSDIEELLKFNLQLKEFGFSYYAESGALICQHITKYATGIETLHILFNHRLEAEYPQNTIHFDRLRNLKTVTLKDIKANSKKVVQAVCDISAAHIPLETLFVFALFNKFSELDIKRFVDGIAKMENLEILYLEFDGLHPHDIINICKHLRKLSKLYLHINKELSMENIVEIVRYSEHLQFLMVEPTILHGNVCIEVATYEKLAEIVEKRAQKTHLEITFHQQMYSMNIPNKLVRTYAGSLSIVLALRVSCPEIGKFGFNDLMI